MAPASPGGMGGAARPAPGSGGTAGSAQMAQIPISMLADISYNTGPPSIRNENGQLVGFVFVDITSDDIGSYVTAASKRINETVQFPPGYYIQWAGQFEYLKSAEQKLKVVVPFTLLIIFVLIYMNTKSAAKTFIVLLAVPFSLVGAFWFLYLLGYNMRMAVWVGLIALAGLDAETGVVMLLYLDHAWEKFRGSGRMNTMGDLQEAVIEGAVQRIRPKVMTICAILFGLLPIMWSPTTQSGADVMKRIAAPMIGGVITSGILELLLYPVIYVLWRRRSLPKEGGQSMTLTTPTRTPTATIEPAPPRRRAKWVVGILVLAALLAGGFFAWKGRGPQGGGTVSGTPFATQTVEGLTVSLIHPQGQLQPGPNDFLIEFRDSSNQLVDVGSVKLDLDMNMPGLVMHQSAQLKRSGAVGWYRAAVKPGMSGDWTARVQFDGPRGKGEIRLPITVGSGPAPVPTKPAQPAKPKVMLNDSQRKTLTAFAADVAALSESPAADNLKDYNL